MTLKPLRRPHYHVAATGTPLCAPAFQQRFTRPADGRAAFRAAVAALRDDAGWTETGSGHIADRPGYRGRRSHERIVWVRFSCNPETDSSMFTNSLTYTICRRPRGWCHTETGE